MTQTLSDRFKEQKRLSDELDKKLASWQNAQQAAEKAAWVAANNYNSLTDKCREEFRVRQQVIEGLKSERSFIVSLVVLGGIFSSLAAQVIDSGRAVAVGYFSPSSAPDGLRWPRGGRETARPSGSAPSSPRQATRCGCGITLEAVLRMQEGTAWSTPSLPGSATTETTSWRISTASRSTSRMPVIRGSNPYGDRFTRQDHADYRRG